MHDNEAYRYLYLHYRASLYSLVLQLIPDQETARDVLQEIFVTVWQKIEQYDDNKGRLFTWLMRITRNVSINKLRSKNYKTHAQNETLDNFVTTISNNPVETNNTNRIGLRQQVHKLRKEYADVIELSFYNGLTHEEISKALNIPLGTVKTRLRSALLELRKQFA